MPERISVLILNYNAPVDSLKACVASVDASDYPDLLEIVVAANTPPGAVDAARSLAARLGKDPVVVRDGRTKASMHAR